MQIYRRYQVYLHEMPLTPSVITFNHTRRNTACTPNVTNKSSMCNLLKFQFTK